MKPVQIVVLLAAGAIGGAVIMKVAVRPQRAHAPAVIPVAAPVVTQVQTPPAAPARDAQPAPTLDKPSPVEPAKGEREAPAPALAERTTAPRAIARRSAAAIPRPMSAHAEYTPAEPMPVIAAPAQAAPAPTTAAPAPAEPAPQPIPPARPEPENATPAPPPAPPEPNRVTLNAGMLIPVRLVDGLSTERNLPGDSFAATLDKELVADGFVIAERGARVEGRVVACDKGTRMSGGAALTVELVRLRTADGQTVAIQTDGFARRGEDARIQNAEKIGGGAALGAVIGALAGGGKGAAIGAGIGGGAGAGTVMASRGNAATLPSETRVTFRLKAPVTITERPRG